MSEFALDGWPSEQREALAFLLDDAQITATWALSSISVPDHDDARVRRFVDFLRPAGAPPDAAGPRGAAAVPDEHWYELIAEIRASDPWIYAAVASPGLRFAGSLVDGFLYAVVAILLATVVGPAAAAQTVSVLVVAYLVLTVGVFGQTLGNLAVSTRVVAQRHDGPPGIRAGFIRWLVPAAPTVLALVASSFGTDLPLGALAFFWALAVYLPVFRGPSHRGLHDLAAGVIVVDDRLTQRSADPARGDQHRDDISG
jgi:uncharacterized RDD family membrane protein YckC